MDTATLAMALAVLKEGSVRGASRLLDRPPSTVADAFERFEADLALSLAVRADSALSFTLAGERMARSVEAFTEILAALARIADGRAAATIDEALIWSAGSAIPVASLSHFNVVVRAGSIRRAARQLGIGQPNLSRQMSHLEKLVGGPLLLRNNAGCEPSPRGMEFNEAALSLVTKISSLTAPAKRRFAREIRTVKLGTIIPVGHESRLAARLARLVAEWRDDATKQDLLVSSTTAEDLVEGLRSGRFDVALMDVGTRHKRFESLEIFSSELVLVGASGVTASAGSIEALIGSRLIAVPSLRSGLRQRVGEALEPYLAVDSSIASRLVEVDALSIVINLVLDHGYLSLLPIDAVSALDRAIGIVRLPGAPQVGFHLVWQRTQAARKVATQIAHSLTSQA
jgi:LysR family nitrogen assimilation transcriptional regulator